MIVYIEYTRLCTVGSQFGAQAQKVWVLVQGAQKQWICREWIIELGLSEVDNG